ncbi:antirestriction protein ArdA [Williamsia sp. 1135]|nr:antirestriction protein ArdA [Williamsia sp. 1135]
MASQLVENLGLLAEVPEEVARYFDHDSYCRDLLLSGDYSTVDAPGGGGV